MMDRSKIVEMCIEPQDGYVFRHNLHLGTVEAVDRKIGEESSHGRNKSQVNEVGTYLGRRDNSPVPRRRAIRRTRLQ